jgi:uncharacterized protein (TIGR03437 family)
LTGTFTSSDCPWRGRGPTNFFNADVYRFNGRAGDRVAVTVNTMDDFAIPWLVLYDANEVPLMQVLSNGASPQLRSFQLPARGFFVLPTTGVYFLDVAAARGPDSRYSLTLNLQSACAYAVTTAAYTFEAAGGTGSVALQTATDCDWVLVSNTSWITANANGARGAGNGTAGFAVAPNPTAMPRTGTLSLGATTITVTQLARTAITSAASFRTNEFAPNSIVAAFGQGLAQSFVAASTTPLPTQLAGTTVRLRDNRNVTRDAPLFVVSPGQINFLIPAEAALGAVTVLILRNGVTVATGEITLVAVVPGLFAANANGQGVPAGVMLRVRNEQQTFEPLVRFDQAANRFVAVPLDLGPPSDDLFLILFGTGFRNRAQNGALTATIGAEPAEVFYAGAQGDFAGLDQLNLRVPRVLLGRGLANLAVTIEGKPLNVLQITMR